MRSVLTVRQKMILGILNTKRGFTQGAYLASQLGVSDRTVRADIQVLQEVLGEYDIEISSIRGKGYLLRTDRPELLQQLTYSAHSLMSQEERVREIALRLAESSVPIDYGDLEDALYISRSTLEGDLREIARRYSQRMPGIRLIRHRNSVSFEPDERRKRMLLNLLHTEHWNYNYEAGMHVSGIPVSEDVFRKLQDAYEEMMRENRVHLSEQDHIRFLFSVAIAVSRILSGHALPESDHEGKDTQDMSTDPGMPMAQDVPTVPDPGQAPEKMPASDLIRTLAKKAQECSGAVFSETEIGALTDEFIQRLRLNGSLPPAPWTDPDRQDQIAGIIRDVLEAADRENGLHLAADRELSGRLLNVFLLWLENPYYTGLQHSEVTRAIRDERPSAAWIAGLLADRTEQVFLRAAGSSVRMDLASHIADALRRETAAGAGDGVRVIFVSHLHPAASGYILNRIRDTFGNRLRIDGPCPPYEYSWMKKDACDFVISTTKLKKDPDCPPAIVISPPFNKLDAENVRYYLEEKEACMLFGRSSCRISEICCPETGLLGGIVQDTGELPAAAVPFLRGRGILAAEDCTSGEGMCAAEGTAPVEMWSAKEGIPAKAGIPAMAGKSAKADLSAQRGSFYTVCSEGLVLVFLQNRDVLRDALVRMKLKKPLTEREVTAEYVYLLLLREDSGCVPLYALEHTAHILRRIHMERRYWRAGEEGDLRKAIRGLEIW